MSPDIMAQSIMSPDIMAPIIIMATLGLGFAILSEASLFFSGALIGSLRPDRPWRWGLAAFLAITLKDLSFYGRDMKVENLATSETYVFLVSNLPVYVSYSIPVIAGAYVGAYLTRGPLR